jgi:hypothetical protein
LSAGTAFPPSRAISRRRSGDKHARPRFGFAGFSTFSIHTLLIPIQLRDEPLLRLGEWPKALHHRVEDQLGIRNETMRNIGGLNSLLSKTRNALKSYT